MYEGRQRAFELRGVRDDRGHELPGARSAARAGRDLRRRLRGHRPRPARLPGQGRAAPRAARRPRARAGRRLRPDRVQRSRALEGGLRGLHATLELFEAANAAGARPGAVRRRRPGADRQPRPRRRGDAGCGWTARAGRRWSTASRAPRTSRASAASSPSSTTTRRPTSRACRRSSASSTRPTSTLLLDSGHLLVAGGDPLRALVGLGASGSGDPRQGRAPRRARRRSRERADTITAWRRGLFCALGDGDVDLAGVLRRRRGTRVRRLGGRRAGPRAGEPTARSTRR